jgi:two-component system LytT family response regulator
VNWRILIVDDEAMARNRIRRLLGNIPGIQSITEAVDGPAAAAAIRAESFDLVFLDVQMPEMDGFDVIRDIGPALMPPLVFVTAYDCFAVKAFEARALDYLLKPVDEARLIGAVDRVRNWRGRTLDREFAGKLESLLGAAPSGPLEDRFAIEAAHRVFLPKHDEIDWIEALGDYVKIHLRGQSHVVRSSMSRMEAKLPSALFLRVHRSAIVNLNAVREVHFLHDRESLLVLRGGARVPASRTHNQRLRALLARLG